MQAHSIAPTAPRRRANLRAGCRRLALLQAVLFGLLVTCASRLHAAPAQSAEHTRAVWHVASEQELLQTIPARAPVQNERIETEMRSASGIMDDAGHFIGGVVLITAGYSADGKYSHYLLVGSTMRLGTTLLRPGKYVFGWTRSTEGLDVHFFDAATGDDRGSAIARQMPAGTRVEPFHLSVPGDRALVQIGRFAIPYTLP